MLTKLEAGKTYRCIDLEGYLNSHHCNEEIWYQHSVNGCYTIDALDHAFRGYNGLIEDTIVINTDAMKFFELVEGDINVNNNNITPETEVTITTTYGDLAAVYYVMGKSNGREYGASLWDIAKGLLDLDQVIYNNNHDMIKHGIIKYVDIQKEWEDLLFKPSEKDLKKKEQQDKIDKLKKELAEAVKELENIE